MDCKPKLLYAEDNRLTAKEMTEILEEEGYEVVTTYSGDEAWETFERISPDLVLLDFRMPGLNGLEVFERIRQVDAEIPVLILSSYNEYCVPSLKSGTADFIRKEADIEEICARIAAVWQRHASGKTNDSAGETVLRLSELTTFHTDSFTLRIGPNIIPLTGALGEVLVLLCRPPRQCRAATDICRQLWHNDAKAKSLYYKTISLNCGNCSLPTLPCTSSASTIKDIICKSTENNPHFSLLNIQTTIGKFQ